MWLLLPNLNWLPASKKVSAVYVKEKKSLYLSTNSILLYFLISFFMSMNGDRIQKFVKQTLCFLFNFYYATHTHTGFLFIYIDR